MAMLEAGFPVYVAPLVIRTARVRHGQPTERQHCYYYDFFQHVLSP